MKNFALTISLFFITLFSLAGGCTHHLNESYTETELGKKVRLTFAVDMSQPSPYCEALSRCQTFQWYKHDGTDFVIIPGETGNYYDTYEPGVYKLVACGSIEGGVIVIEEGEVYKNEVLLEKTVTRFSVYPNPTTESTINLLVPHSPISLESFTYKIELYNVLGNQVVLKEGLEFGTGNYPLNLQSQGKGIFMLRITSGEEVKVLKILLR